MTTYKKDDVYLQIVTDIAPQNPREFDTLGTMATWHSRYTIGDTQPDVSPSEFLNNLPADTIVLPLYLLDHSGLTLSTEPFNCPFDSGKVGFIYATPDDWMEHGVKPSEVAERLRTEVQTYQYYLEGAVYGFQMFQMIRCETCGVASQKVLDSCYGFYGYGPDDNGIFEAAGITDISTWEIVSENELKA